MCRAQRARREEREREDVSILVAVSRRLEAANIAY